MSGHGSKTLGEWIDEQIEWLKTIEKLKEKIPKDIEIREKTIFEGIGDYHDYIESLLKKEE